MNPQAVDAIVIGAGQAGGPLASALARAGKRTIIIEREHVGGTCINEGCTPTKTMVASARAAYVTRRGADYGVRSQVAGIDMVRVRQRKRDIVKNWSEGSKEQLESTEGVTLIMGAARFTGPKTITVKRNTDGGEAIYTAEQIFINTGLRPAMPNIPGLSDVPTLNSTSIMELDAVPDHLVILGGGYVGLEFGQMFRRFGSRVTVINRGGHLLGREDDDVAEGVVKILQEDGIDILLNASTQAVSRAQGLGLSLTIGTPDGQRTITGSHLLVATGREPTTKDLHLDAAGVVTDDKGYIIANELLETNVAGIYALGDVKGGPAFTHVSYDDFRILRANLLEGGGRTTADRLPVYTVFIDPQLGRVGLTEREARDAGRNIRVAKLGMDAVARAIETDETRGFMKAIVDADSGQILGAAILGIEGGEVMSALQIAMMGHLPYTALRDATFAHPTLCESLNNLFMALDEQ